jgi:Sec-independent protein secretion pathway component TatC
MWTPAIGISEVVFLLLVICVMWLSGAFSRRLAKGIIPCFIIAMVVTPGDLYSMLIVGIPLSIAFTCGVLFAPSIPTSDEEIRTK